MKNFWYIIVFFIIGGQAVYAQIDRTRVSIPVVIPLEEAPEQVVSDSIKVSLMLKQKQASTIKSIDFTGKSRYVKPTFNFNPDTRAFNPFQVEAYKAIPGDQFFGEVTEKGDFVVVYCRDHEAIDGDRVSILVNGKVEVQDVFLTGGFRGFYIQLSPGFNKIEFLALNQGESGPNTAQFQVYDLQGLLLKDEKWNLGTGYKAGFVVVKPVENTSKP